VRHVSKFVDPKWSVPMQKFRGVYLEERAEQLAIVYPSRRDDLLSQAEAGSDDGIDLLVNLLKLALTRPSVRS